MENYNAHSWYSYIPSLRTRTQEAKDKFLMDHLEDPKAVEIAIRNGANVRAQDNMAIIEASDKGYEKTVEILLKAGADPKARKSLAIKTAYLKRHTKVVCILSSFGACF